MWQLVENKQKFIAQIMTSKSPVRAAEDVDETALSFAEVKMLATGNPYIKEKMDLDIKVSELAMLKQSFLNEKYHLEDEIAKLFPEKIKGCEARLNALREDVAFFHTQPKEEGVFPGMEVKGTFYAEKKDAGFALLTECKTMKSPEKVEIGSYRGFAMFLSFDTVAREYVCSLKHSLTHNTALGDDVYGNITRLDNVLSGMEGRIAEVENELSTVIKQRDDALEEVKKPFAFEQELTEKRKRLSELDALLEVDKGDDEIVDEDISEDELNPQREEPERER